MATKVTLLQLSPTMTEGRIVKWLVKEGDEVSSGQPIAEVETDKAVMEQESFEDGKVLKVLNKEGDTVPVGATIMVTGEEGEDISALLSAGAAPAAPSKKNDHEPIPSPDAPKAAAPPARAGNGKRESQPSRRAPEPAPAAAAAAPAAPTGGRVVASPLARKMAQEKGLDLAALQGSGPSGRIVRRDIEQAIESGATARPAAASAALVLAEEEFSETIELTGMRTTIARRLVESKQSVPHFQLTAEVRGERLIELQDAMRERHPEEKVSITHLLIKAMASTLMRHKMVRGQWAGKQIRIVGAAHISVAVALESGLVTPVIRDAHRKGVLELARELRELAQLARDRKLKPEQMTGGVQTISNLGMFGIHEFNAIINPPESTILAIGAMEDRAVIEDGQLVPGKVMKVTMSCDHRVVDGAVGAAYLADLKAALENPSLMLL